MLSDKMSVVLSKAVEVTRFQELPAEECRASHHKTLRAFDFDRVTDNNDSGLSWLTAMLLLCKVCFSNNQLAHFQWLLSLSRRLFLKFLTPPVTAHHDSAVGQANNRILSSEFFRDRENSIQVLRPFHPWVIKFINDHHVTQIGPQSLLVWAIRGNHSYQNPK